jgi:hypothetical protein
MHIFYSENVKERDYLGDLFPYVVLTHIQKALHMNKKPNDMVVKGIH